MPIRRLFLLALLPLALAACDDAAEDTFFETTDDIEARFSFTNAQVDAGGELTVLQASSGDDIRSEIGRVVPSGSGILSAEVTSAGVDINQPVAGEVDLLNEVELYLVSSAGRVLVARGSGFTTGSMQSEAALTATGNDVGSVIAGQNVRAEMAVNADLDAGVTYVVEARFEIEVEFE